MPESLLVSVCAAGRRGVPIRNLFDARPGLDPDIRNWLWEQLLRTSGVSFRRNNDALELSDNVRYDEVAEDEKVRVVASKMQREVYLGVHQRGYFLSAIQITLLEAIGSGQAAGCTRAEIDSFLKNDPIPHKEFFRHCKSLLSHNLIVRLNSFSATPRIGKYAPPTAYPRWFLRRFIQLPLPARSWVVASTPAVIQQQCIDRRHHIDTTVVPRLLQFLTERSPETVPEPDLRSFAERQSLLDDLDWIAVRERLFATNRVAWDYLETFPGQFAHGFRIVGSNDAGPSDIPIEDALISRESDRILPLDILMTPLSAQVYRLIDASGSSGILSLTLFRQLRLMQRRGHKIIGELSRLPGNDAVVQVADRHKTSLVYRLYRKANMLQNSSTGTIKVESRSSRRQSRSKDIVDEEEDGSEEEEDDNGKIVDSFFMRRLRWIRDIVAFRKAVSLNMLCHIVRHREIASVASCALKSIARLCNQLEADGDIVQRCIHPGDDDEFTLPVTVAVDPEFLASFPEEAEVKIDDAARIDPRSEYDLKAQDKSKSNCSHSARSDSYLIAYPVLCGFVRMRMVRAKLFHLHLASITLESRPHVRHWYLCDVFLSMPLSLFLMIAGAFEALPRDVICNERLLSLPIRHQSVAVQGAIMSALLDGIQYQSLRVQDILEILQRLGLVRIWMPAAHPATWQITLNSDSLVSFPDTVFDSLDSIHQFWFDLRMHCKAVFISEHRDKIPLQGVDDSISANTELLDRLPANLFPELYAEVNWFAGHDLPDNKQDALEALDNDQRIETEEALNEACEQFIASTGKAAWFLAQLHFEFVREFCKTVDVTDHWRPDPVLRRRDRSENTPFEANRKKRRRRSSLADDVKDIDGTPSRRIRNDLRTRLYLRGLSPEPPSEPINLAKDHPALSPVAEKTTPVRPLRRRSLRKADSVPPTPAESEPEAPALVPESWTEELFNAAKRNYTAGSDRQRDDIILLSKEPRLNCVLTTIKMILLQPDDLYNADDGKAALKDFTDDEVEWAFKILSTSHLAVLRKNTPGSKAARGHFTISAKARDHYRHPVYPLVLRDSLRSQFFVRTSAVSCKPECVAISISLASTGVCKIDSDDRSILLELDDLVMSAVVDAYDSCVCTVHHDVDAFELPSSTLSDEISNFALSCGASGVDQESLSSMFPGDAGAECLRWLTACDRIVIVDCFSERRFVHANYQDIYVIGDVTRRSWVQLSGELNEELLRNLHWMIISYLCDKPATERDVLVNRVPFLSPLEFDLLINCMELDGAVALRVVGTEPMIRIPIKFLEGDQLQLAMPRSFLESTRTSSDLIGPASFIDNPSHSYRGTTRRASIESDIGEAIIPLTHDAFEKCTILPLTPVMSSSLTKSLQDLQQSGSSNSGLDHINVVMFENPESVRVSLSSSLATVEAVVGFLMQKYQLKGRAYDYELRLLDDEDDYMADFDLPPLDFNVDMRSFAVDRVALCHHKRSASASADSWDSPLCRFLRVRMPQNECHVVPIVDDQNLKDVLEILARKRAQNLSPEEYTFYYMGHREPLDYEMAVCELTDYCIELRRQSQEYIVLPTTFGSSPNPSSFMFTDESASTYSEWSVQKKNRWGRKQYRLLGIDRYNLYNTSVTGTVKRSCRHISDVVAVKVIKNKPRCFRILFRNLEANEIIPVEYTAHSEMECAEIVARIDYLKSLMPPIR